MYKKLHENNSIDCLCAFLDVTVPKFWSILKENNVQQVNVYIRHIAVLDKTNFNF